jgi:diacylglycerol O-acyltransferase
MRRAPVIDRVSADDLMSLVAERGSTPMQVGAVLLLDVTAGVGPAEIIRQLGRRAAGVPRLRQRLVSVPVGCGRPIWVDDPGFTITRQVRVVEVSSPGGVPGDPLPRGPRSRQVGGPASLPEDAVLRVAAEVLAAPLPRDRPLWVATLVTAPHSAEAALIVVFHHVLADGIGGLAVLGALVDDGGPVGPAPHDPDTDPDTDRQAPFPRPAPSNRQLAGEAARRRVRALGELPVAVLRLAAATGQLRLAPRTRLPRTSLNVPTGPRRRFTGIRVSLQQTLDVARAQGATVNDVLLVAAAGALHRLLEGRGERLDDVVISVPFSARNQASTGQLGNQSGVIPLTVPAVGDPATRLRRVAVRTRVAKRTVRGASTALIGPLFRLLARLGLYRRFINRQRLIHTFSSNVRGPDTPLALAGCPITAVLPLSAATGNVTVAFAVLSYAGTLAITLVADPDACPDLPGLREYLVAELHALGIAAREP